MLDFGRCAAREHFVGAFADQIRQTRGRHLADFAGSEVRELLPRERLTVAVIGPVEKLSADDERFDSSRTWARSERPVLRASNRLRYVRWLLQRAVERDAPIRRVRRQRDLPCA